MSQETNFDEYPENGASSDAPYAQHMMWVTSLLLWQTGLLYCRATQHLCPLYSRATKRLPPPMPSRLAQVSADDREYLYFHYADLLNLTATYVATIA